MVILNLINPMNINHHKDRDPQPFYTLSWEYKARRGGL